MFCCAVFAPVRAAETKITFYHTSDLHEHSGNLPRIAEFVDAQRKKEGHIIFLDTGDWCNKGDLTPLNTRGEAIVEMMGACKYDAVIPGNHDYSFGTKRLAELVDKYKIPLRVANCTWLENTKPKCAAPYKIHTFDKVRVAIIGIATLNRDQAADKLKKLDPVAQSVKKVLDELAGKADIFVLMTHLGPPEDRKLIKALPRLDIVFGGHHHQRFTKLEYNKTTRTALQHSGCFGNHLGEMVITWDGKQITEHKVRLIKITRDMPASTRVRAVADKYLKKQASVSSRKRPAQGHAIMCGLN